MDIESALLSEDVGCIEAVIQSALSGSDVGVDQPDLRVTGLEPLLAAIALKTVVGVASGFMGRLLYDMWKSAKGRKDLDRVAKMLTDRLNTSLGQPVPEAQIRADILGMLTLEGLTADQAKRVCDEAFARMSLRLAQ
jgi:hypothetical protein